MRFVIDIDGIICDTIYTKNSMGIHYDYSTKKEIVINKINKLFDEGNEIILFTSRGERITDVDWNSLTKSQLDEWKVKYHKLIFGKPWADYYVDDKNISIEEFLDNGNSNSS